MIRNVRLYGSLEKAAGRKDFKFGCNTQAELFNGLKVICPSLNMHLRQGKQVYIFWTETLEQEKAKTVESGFRFSDKARYLHVCTGTEGAYAAIPYLIEALVAIVVSYVIVKLTMPSMKQNNNSSRSTMFNGPVNATEQGNPIPIICGKKLLVGSQIISAAEQYYNTV